MNDINFTMYKLAGIIAEYDPFHNGHAWQLQQAKALGARRVAVAMSCAPLETLEDMEREMIRKALERHEGNLSAVASRLGITRQTLYNKMKKFNL